MSDENTFCFPEAVFQVRWTREQRTSLLNASQSFQPGIRALVPFVLPRVLTFKEGAIPSIYVLPRLSLFSSPSPPQFPFNTFPSPSLELLTAFCLARLLGTAHHSLQSLTVTPSGSALLSWLCFLQHGQHWCTLITLPHPTDHQMGVFGSGSELAVPELPKWFRFLNAHRNLGA